MEIIAPAGLLALTLVIYLLLRNHREAQAEWALERRELLNRIQQPQFIPTASPPAWRAPDVEPDESEFVGTITYPQEEEEIA